jgi:hypothetical protein
MWKTFEKALGRRASKSNGEIEFDGHTVVKTAVRVLEEMFGTVGKDNFSVVAYDRGSLKIKTQASAWSCEIRLRKDKIIRKINDILKQEVVKKLILYN